MLDHFVMLINSVALQQFSKSYIDGYLSVSFDLKNINACK